jgi:hypothetical protein
MKQSLLDYGVVLDRVPLLCDNESAVKIANNPVQHLRTKHIDIRLRTGASEDRWMVAPSCDE